MFSAATWNVQFGTHVRLAAEHIERTERLRSSDVLLLQEMDEEGTDWLSEQLGWQYTYHAISAHRQSGRPFGNAVLSPHPVTPLAPAALPRSARFRGHPRHLTVAQIALPAMSVAVGSVHLETPWLSLSQRVEQLARALDTFDDYQLPVVVGGDLNTFTRRARRLMSDVGDGFVLREPPESTLRWRRMEFRLDHFATRGLEVDDQWVGAPTPASDHQPFWASFTPLG
ncbi:MAG: endonuclease/exonuclease/phosphatase family protein [Propioniciclava sp.]